MIRMRPPKPVSLVEIGAWPNRLITVIEPTRRLYTYIHTHTYLGLFICTFGCVIVISFI